MNKNTAGLIVFTAVAAKAFFVVGFVAVAIIVVNATYGMNKDKIDKWLSENEYEKEEKD